MSIVWTPEKEALLLKLARAKVPPAERAERLGCTEGAGLTRLRRLTRLMPAEARREAMGSSVRRWTPVEKARLCHLVLNEGHKATAAALALNRSVGSVQTMMSHLQLHSTMSRVPEEVRYAIVERHSQNWKPSRIARQVGVAVHVVERVLVYQAGKAAAAEARKAERVARRSAVRARQAEAMRSAPADPVAQRVLEILKTANGPVPARDIAVAVFGDTVRYPTDAVRSRVLSLRSRGTLRAPTATGSLVRCWHD